MMTERTVDPMRILNEEEESYLASLYLRHAAKVLDRNDVLAAVRGRRDIPVDDDDRPYLFAEEAVPTR
jgi:hypothetical protein